jgi:hypothetical protein
MSLNRCPTLGTERGVAEALLWIVLRNINRGRVGIVVEKGHHRDLATRRKTERLHNYVQG